MSFKPVLSLAQLEAFDPRGGRGPEKGKRWRCPLCADNCDRDLSANTRTGLWNCKRCLAKGILHEFREEQPTQTSGRDFARQRAQETAQRAFTVPPLPSASEVPQEAPDEQRRAKWREQRRALVCLGGTPGAAYLARRALAVDLCERARVMFSPSWFGHPATVFPAYDGAGRLTGAQGRFINGKTNPKALTFGIGAMFSGAFWTPGAQEAPLLALTEAPIDALSLALCGLPSVAVFGSNLPAWMPGALHRRRVFVASDAEPGKGDLTAAKWSAALESFGARCTRLRPDAAFCSCLSAGVKDWNEALQELGAQDLKELLAMDLEP